MTSLISKCFLVEFPALARSLLGLIAGQLGQNLDPGFLVALEKFIARLYICTPNELDSIVRTIVAEIDTQILEPMRQALRLNLKRYKAGH